MKSTLAPLAPSPFAFLAALRGERELDRAVIGHTRSEELQICGHMALAAKVATLYAFSGNGKSSLIQAGLIPFFNDLGYAVFKTRPRPPFALSDPTTAFKEGCIRENWIPGISASDGDAVGQARQELQATSGTDLPAVRRLLDRLDAQQIRLSATAENRGADLSAYLARRKDATMSAFLEDAQKFLNMPIIVICDQFEEIFVHYYNTPALAQFIEGLRQACNNPSLRVHFLFSMREDWVGSMIVFRDAIPDVFNCTYRLDPIRRSKAAPALMLPLQNTGVQLDDAVASRILDDLADFYRRQQGRDDVAIHLTPSRPDDPFIELPALQTVADRLWETRGSFRTPFSLTHYNSLATAEEIAASGSPAAGILDGYLRDTLQRIDDGDSHPDDGLDELRLDVLYLLTDKIAHRKALGGREILAELNMIRATAEGVSTNQAMLVRALKPLQDCRLVREDAVSSTDPRYELAHDFVVRSVVRAWKALDRRRAEAAAVRAEQRKQNTFRLAALVRSENLAVKLIPWLTAALFGTLFLLASSLSESYEYGGYGSLGGVGGYLQPLYFSVLSALLGLSVVFRVRTGIAISVGAIGFYVFVLFGRISWPDTSAELALWTSALLCMIPALIVDLSNVRGEPDTQGSGWLKSATRATDYAMFLLSAIVGFWWMIANRYDPSPFGILGPAVVVIVVQSAAIVRARKTIGEWWTKYDLIRSRLQRFLLLAASLVFVLVNLFLLAIGMEPYSSALPWAPYGAPMFFVFHVVALSILYWFVDRRGAPSKADEVVPGQTYASNEPVNDFVRVEAVTDGERDRATVAS
jgi:conflict system STAND superfamily ATPase